MVEEFLDDPTSAAWKKFRSSYWKVLQSRYDEDPAPFEALADLARENDVFIGCNCPTRTNPDVRHCHTYPALEFMKEKFPDLDVVFPKAD